MNRRVIVLSGAALVFVCALGQSPSMQEPPDRQVFRTGTNLAIIDAVAVDDRGQHVRDLTADDFEIVQLSPGSYTLQIAAARARNGKVTPLAAQWATFEVR